MIRKIIDTNQEPLLTLELPKNLRGKRIEVIAFEIEEEISISPVETNESFDKNAAKKWHSVDESETIVLEAVKKHYANRH